jgi:hypothetical protein
MPSINEQEIADGVFEDVEPPCVALVPLAQEVQWVCKLPLPRPDPSFVTQLIATAEHDPQTRNLRRAAPADALSAYTAHRHPTRDAGIRTRQVI